MIRINFLDGRALPVDGEVHFSSPSTLSFKADTKNNRVAASALQQQVAVSIIGDRLFFRDGVQFPHILDISPHAVLSYLAQ